MRHRNSASTTFAPWRADRVRSVILALIVAPLSGLGLHMAGAPHGVAAAFAFGFVALAASYWHRAKVRAFGKTLEDRAVSRATRALQQTGLSVETGRMTAIGDVDLIVRSANTMITVEIKAFRYWRSRLRDIARQRRARHQAQRQRRLVGAHRAVLWLPNARETWLSRLLSTVFPEKDPVVIVGGTNALAHQLGVLFGRIR